MRQDRRMKAMAAAVASSLLLGTSATLQAQPSKGGTYPDRTIRLLIGFAPGGGADTAARPFAQRLGETLGQSVVVDNRPGAGGNIATGMAARAAPDGYTLLVGTIGALAINPAIYPKLDFDSVKDFAPITNMVSSINVLVLNPSVPAKSVKDLIELARAKKGALTFGSSGVGSAGHLSGVLMQEMTGIEMTHVPYKGGAPAMTALVGGEIQLIFATAATAIPQINANRVRGLAVTTATRAAMLPKLPTIAESGLPGYEANNWYGLLAPAGTSRAIVNRLNTESVSILKSEFIRDLYFKQGLEATPSTPEAFAAYIKSERTKWAKVVKAAGVTPE